MGHNIANTAYPPDPTSLQQAEKAAAAVTRARDVAEATYDVVITQAVRVCIGHGLSQRQAADKLRLSKSDVNRLVKRITASGGWGWTVNDTDHDTVMNRIAEAWSRTDATARRD